MTNRERQMWIDNDEGLYNAWLVSQKSKSAFIKENKTEIDSVLDNVVSGKKPAHYLAYQK